MNKKKESNAEEIIAIIGILCILIVFLLIALNLQEKTQNIEEKNISIKFFYRFLENTVSIRTTEDYNDTNTFIIYIDGNKVREILVYNSVSGNSIQYSKLQRPDRSGEVKLLESVDTISKGKHSIRVLFKEKNKEANLNEIFDKNTGLMVVLDSEGNKLILKEYPFDYQELDE